MQLDIENNSAQKFWQKVEFVFGKDSETPIFNILTFPLIFFLHLYYMSMLYIAFFVR